jgi:N-acetylmuramoyl-L-alanine amidase
MAQISNIIIHESASAFGDRWIIDRWHRERGWPGIGYHWVICNGWREKGVRVPALDGAVQQGIPLDADNYIRGAEIGRHTLGYNATSIGICLIGEKGSFSSKQWVALRGLVKTLMGLHHIALTDILGHYETASGRAQGKTCPGFDMQLWREDFKKFGAQA